MVVYNPALSTCEIFEVKHSKEIHPKQYQHLTDPDKIEKTHSGMAILQGDVSFTEAKVKSLMKFNI